MTITAVYRGGVLVPLGPVDFQEGDEIRFEPQRSKTTDDGLLLSTLARAAREMNPEWKWDRDSVYDDE